MSSIDPDHRSRHSPDSEPMQQMFESARCGAPGARSRLIRHHMPDLRRRASNSMRTAHCERVEPDDIIQETLLNVFRHIEEFRPWDYHGFEHYLHKTLSNKVRDEMRHECSMHLSPAQPDSLPSGDSDPHQDLAARELWKKYRAIVERLPERTRIAVILRVEKRLPYAKVAEAAGCSNAHAARMLVSRALGRIATLLKAGPAEGRGHGRDSEAIA